MRSGADAFFCSINVLPLACPCHTFQAIRLLAVGRHRLPKVMFPLRATSALAGLRAEIAAVDVWQNKMYSLLRRLKRSRDNGTRRRGSGPSARAGNLESAPPQVTGRSPEINRACGD